MGKKLLLFPFLVLLFIPLSIWGQACPTSVSISSDQGNNICEGTSVTFTANPSGGTNLEFQWQVNDSNVGSGTSQFTTSSLNNGDKVKVIVTSNDDAGCSITSSYYTMTVNTKRTPTVNISSSPSTKCVGQNITFTASNTNGGSNPNYSWYVNSSSSPAQNSSSATFSTSGLPAGTNSIKVVLTSSLNCLTSPTAEKTITISVNDNASITPTSDKDQSVCINTSLTPIVYSIGGSGTGATVTGLPSGVSGSYNSGNFTINGTPTQSGSFNYTVTTAGPCGQNSESGTITVNKDASINLTSGNASQEVCQDEAIEDIVYNIGENGDDATVTGLPSGITGSFSGGVYTIEGSSSEIGTHNFTIRAIGSCSDSESLNGSITISENLTPSVSISSSDSDNTICEGTSITFTATPVNGGSSPSYQWKIGSADVGNNSSTFTTNSLAIGNQSVSVVLTSSETCLTQPTATSEAIITTVNENLTPEVTISASDSDICEGENITFTATPVNGGPSPSYQWKINGNNVGSNSSTFSSSTLQNGQKVTVIMTSNATCLAASTATSNEITMIVNPPAPSVPGAITGPIEVCSTATNLEYSIAAVANATSYNWSLPSGWSITSGNNTNVIKVNASSSSGTISVTAENNCGKSSSASTLNVTSVAGVPASPGTIYSDLDGTNKTVCPPTTVNFNVSGSGSYKWTLPSGWEILSGAGTNAIQVRITDASTSGTKQVSVVARNICGDSTPSVYGGIEINDHIVADFGEDKTICKSQSNIQLTGTRSFGSASLDVNFTTSGSGSFSGGPGGNNKNGTFTVTYTPSTNDKNTGQVILTMTVPEPKGNSNNGNKCGVSSDSMTLYFTPDATISSPANKDQTVCINTALNEIDFTLGGGATGATINNLPSGLSGSYNSRVFKISGTPTQAGTFSYTINTTGNCSSQQTSIGGTLTVTPDNTINDPTNKNQEVCINNPIENIIFSGNSSVSGATVTGIPNGVTGSFSGGNYTLSGTPTQAGTFNYTVTTSGNCKSVSQSGTLIVDPDPSVDSPSNKDQVLCINTGLDPIQFAISGTATDADVTGLPTGLSGSYNNGTYTISGNPSEAGTFDYTVTTVGPCANVSQNGQLTVKADPTAEISYSGEFCTSQSGAVTVSLTGTGNYTGGAYYSSPAGITLDSDTGDIYPGTSQPGTYTVSYDTPAECQVATATTTVVIHPEPSVEISYDSPVCNNGLIDVSFENPVGAYENGTFSATPGGLVIDSTSGQINASSSSPGTYTVAYEIPISNGCSTATVTTDITITQLPQVSISYPAELCTGNSEIVPVTFSGTAGNYEGGTFTATSGLSIDSNGNIDPSNSSAGNHTVTYTIETAEGCSEVTASFDLVIYQEVEITTEPVNYGTCSTEPAEFEVIASGDNLSYQWYKKNSGGTFDPLAGETGSTLSFSNATSANAGEYQVIVSSSNGICSSKTSETVTLNIDENIIITKPAEDVTICEDEISTISFDYEAHANGAPLTFQWIKDGNPISNLTNKYTITESETGGVYTGTLTIDNIDLNDDGVYAVEISGPDYFTCPSATSKSFTFRVKPRPGKPGTENIEICLNEEASELTATKEDGNELLWYEKDSSGNLVLLGNSVTPETDTPRDISYWVTQKHPNGCESDPEELIVTVLDTPPSVSTETLRFEYCYGEPADPLEITPADGAELYWYDTAEGGTASTTAPTPNTNEVKLSTYWVSQVFTSTTGCESDRTKVEININELPNLNITIADGADSTICLGSSITLQASGAATYEWSLDESVVSTDANYTITPPSDGSFLYKLKGIDDKGCTNYSEITINVDPNTVTGTLTGPSSVCETQPNITLELKDYVGDIQKWEYKPSGSSEWIDFADGQLGPIRSYELQSTTSFRVTLKSGVCEPDYAEATVALDPLPEGGELLFATNSDRIFLTCENAVAGYGSQLNLSGQSGQILHWEYRGVSDNSWNEIDSQETFLTASQVESVVSNESTAFRALLVNGACDSGIYSATALVSVIQADIKPQPVEVDKDVICIGDQITLSSSTGYGSEGGKFEGGAFDNAGIKNHGWKFTNLNGGSNDFDSAANNGRADHWLRMNPHGQDPQENEKVYTSNIPYNGNGTMENFRTYSGSEGNKGFALVTGDNDSRMETPPFSLGGLDEAILTFDQAYNLTNGATIIVEISKDGGQTYPTNSSSYSLNDPDILYYHVGDGTLNGRSGNFNHFGEGIPDINQMTIDLGDYLGQPNLRIRFTYIGIKDGDVWAVDNIKVPEGPQDVELIWYYDDDLNNPDNTLEQIGAVNQEVVPFVPRKIGWNDFEVQTKLILDSNGNACQSIENFETIRVFAFDRYTTDVVAQVGSCGTTTVTLNASVFAEYQDMAITSYPTADGYEGEWLIEGPGEYTITNQDSETSLEPVNNPNIIFEADELGAYTFSWILKPTSKDENGNLLDNSGCPPVINPSEVNLIDCTTLDFDGFDDYIDLGTNYSGFKMIEAWIRPFTRPLPDGGNTNPSTGTIISGPGFDISMQSLPNTITPDTRWYHIAVSNTGEVWVDGISQGSITMGSGGNRTIIGARWASNDKETENHFSGWIEEVRIWNKAPELREIRFMMNQRIKLDASGTVISPLEGEVVPNKSVSGSYLTDASNNNLHLEADDSLLPFYDQTSADLAGYYRLISADPDPDNLTSCVTFSDNLKPTGGYTPDHAANKVAGRLVNIETNQENTSPTPYCSGADGTWSNVNTWARPDVWDYPNSTYNSQSIEWNIARINHDIQSGDKHITMLGLLSETLNKQLTIEADHFIRISHYLLLDGNMDLQGESQLLQDHGSILANSSQGWAEIDQQGRMSSFNYNYWTSPVSNQGSDNNSGFMLNKVLLDGTNPANPQGIKFRDGYFVADGPKTSPITISNEWIWDFRGGDADIYGDWLHLGSDYTEIVGAGFSMKGTTGNAGLGDKQNYVFRGKPNNGNIPTTELYLNNEQNYLVGNPYPSAIDADKFLRDNLVNVGTGTGNNENSENVFNGTLYYWDHFDGFTHILKEYIGGYATYTLAGQAPAISNDWRINDSNPTLSGGKTPKQFVPVAQGFFLNSASVSGQSFGGKIIFKNTQRVFVPKSSNSIFLAPVKVTKNKKSPVTDTRAKIRLKFNSPAGYHRQILVTRDENTTNGFDIGYDAPLIEDNVEDMYWWFENHGFVIQGVPDFEEEQVLPLAIKVQSEGQFTIQIDSTENWPAQKNIYLKDNKLDTIHSIIKEPYKATSEVGEIKDRFELVFFKPLPDIVDNPEELPVIDGLVGISYSRFDKQVKISNEDLLKVSKVLIFDMRGKLIQEFDELPTEREILLGMRPVRSAVYIVKVYCENGICNKKIIVKQLKVYSYK